MTNNESTLRNIEIEIAKCAVKLFCIDSEVEKLSINTPIFTTPDVTSIIPNFDNNVSPTDLLFALDERDIDNTGIAVLDSDGDN